MSNNVLTSKSNQILALINVLLVIMSIQNKLNSGIVDLNDANMFKFTALPNVVGITFTAGDHQMKC